MNRGALFSLTRTLPNGWQVTHSTFFRTRRAASLAAAYVLHDNGVASRSEAGRFAAELDRQPLGKPLKHESGYEFRIEAVA